MQKLRFGFLAFAALLMAPLAIADQASAPDDYCQRNPDDCIAVGEWQFSVGVGLGGRSNPLVDGDTIPILLLPQLSYYGERFFFDTASMGFTFIENRRHQLNAVATLGLDNMYFNDLSLGNFVIEGTGGGFNAGGLVTSGSAAEDLGGTSAPAERDETRTPNTTDPDGPSEFFHKPTMAQTGQEEPVSVDIDDIGERRLAGLAGLEYSFFMGRSMLSAQWLTDFTGVHDGQELRLGLDHRLRSGVNDFALSAGAVWQSEEIVNYYYGLDASDVGDITDLYYRGSDTVSPFIRLDWVRPLGRGWSLQTTVHQKWFGSGISDSPLMDRDFSTTVFVGGVYHF